MAILAAMVDRRGLESAAGRVRAMLKPLQRGDTREPLISEEGTAVVGISETRLDPRLGTLIDFHQAGKVRAVIDGRLRSTGELKAQLDLSPTATDAETIVAGFTAFGTDLFGRLRGDFAILVWDGNSNVLTAARDAFGIRPLCYSASSSRVLVASDPEQLLACGLVAREPDEDTVLDYLLWDPRFPDRTFFREISALPGGHVLVAGPEGQRVFRYAIPGFGQIRFESKNEYWNEYRRRFAGAVEFSLESTSPVVAELSGGLDSSCIVGMADRIAKATPGLCPGIVAATALYPGLACDEGPFARAVAARIEVPVRYWNALDTSVNELERSSIAVPGGRFATFAGTEGQLDIMRTLGARVLVSGMGGDQIGTSSGVIRDAVTDLRWRDAARMTLHWPRATAKTPFLMAWVLARSFAPPLLRKANAALRSRAHRRPWLSRWANGHRRFRPAADHPRTLEAEVHRRNWRSLNSGLHAFAMTYLHHHALRNGIEVRCPFLDLDLVSIALSVPARLWPPPWPGERLHREILADLLPTEVLQRRGKANFQPALVRRIRRHLPYIKDLLGSGRWVAGHFVDQAGARQLLETFEGSAAPNLETTYSLWAIATLEAWMRAVFEYDSPRRM